MLRFVSVIAVFALSAWTINLASAQSERETARIQFERGVELYETHNYEGALAAFQEAYRLAPHPTVRVNMANCYEHLDRPIEALHHFERFLVEAENAPRQQRREVTAAVARMRARVGEIRLSIAPDGATVVIDEAETRRAPVLEPVLLPIGVHTIVVRLDGYRSARERVTIRGGESQSVSIRLERGADGSSGPPTPAVAAATPSTTTSSRPSEAASGGAAAEPTAVARSETDEGTPSSSGEPTYEDQDDGGGFQPRLTTPVLIFGTAAVALGVGAIITGALALSANDDFESALVRFNNAGSETERQQARMDGLGAADSANTLSVVTDVLLVGAIAAAGAATFFLIIDGMNGDDEQATADVGGVRLRLAPSAAPSGAGLTLEGAF